MTKKPKEKYTTFGLSFPDERVLDSAKIKAKELGMSLSAYVNHLIRKDIGMPGAFTHDLHPPIAGTSPPRDVSQTRPSLTNPSVTRESAPLSYPKPDEHLRFVAEDHKKKPRH